MDCGCPISISLIFVDVIADNPVMVGVTISGLSTKDVNISNLLSEEDMLSNKLSTKDVNIDNLLSVRDVLGNLLSVGDVLDNLLSEEDMLSNKLSTKDIIRRRYA